MATFKEKLKSKIPSWSELLPVFSILIFLVFTWTLYRMFWYLPSWLGDLPVWDVLIMAAYVLSFALFESLVMLGLMVLIALILPSRIFRQDFVAQASALALLLGAGAYLLQRKMGILYELSLRQLAFYPLVVLAAILVFILVFSYLFKRFEGLRRLVHKFAEWMTVFAYIYVPLGLLGLVVVILRLIF